MYEQQSKFLVSVIIPVFNAEKYLKKAVESAVHLEEVGEIILVEDNSPDNALQICKELEKQYEKVNLYQHPDKKNHGAGASRNLGIEKALCGYIAFLDADDYFLPNRFIKDKEILTNNPEIDGVYNALGIYYYSDKAKQKFIDAGYKYQEFFTLSDEVPPEELFFVLFNEHPTVKGEFSTLTITVRKSIFDNTGFFNTKLPLKQDTHLWRRMAAVGKLASGNIKEAVAIRGVHENNRMTNKILHQKINAYWWKDLHQWFKNKNIKLDYLACFEKAMIFNQVKTLPRYKGFYHFLVYFLKNKKYIKKRYDFFDIVFYELFGKNKITNYLLIIKTKILNNAVFKSME